MAEAGFWEDNVAAQKVIEEANAIKEWIIPYRELHTRVRNVAELLPEISEGRSIAHICFFRWHRGQ